MWAERFRTRFGQVVSNVVHSVSVVGFDLIKLNCVVLCSPAVSRYVIVSKTDLLLISSLQRAEMAACESIKKCTSRATSVQLNGLGEVLN